MKITILAEDEDYYLVVYMGLYAFVLNEEGWTTHAGFEGFAAVRASERGCEPIVIDFIEDICNISPSERLLIEMLYPDGTTACVLDTLSDHIRMEAIL